MRIDWLPGDYHSHPGQVRPKKAHSDTQWRRVIKVIKADHTVDDIKPDTEPDLPPPPGNDQDGDVAWSPTWLRTTISPNTPKIILLLWIESEPPRSQIINIKDIWYRFHTELPQM